MTAPDDEKATSALLGDILHRVTSLIRKEIDLARSEMAENINRAFVALGLLVVAVVLALTALDVLAAAAVAGLVAGGMEAGWAAALIGGGLAIIALLLVMKGLRDLKRTSLAPTRAAQELRKNTATFKEAFND